MHRRGRVTIDLRIVTTSACRDVGDVKSPGGASSKGTYSQLTVSEGNSEIAQCHWTVDGFANISTDISPMKMTELPCIKLFKRNSDGEI